MKLIKTIKNVLIILAIIIIAYFVWNILQKQEIIVTDTTKSVVNKLKTVSKLETTEMTITKIIEAEKDLVDLIPSISFDNTIQDLLFQDKMIFELEWTIVAWVDLDKLETGDVRTNVDGSVSINLPVTEILHTIINENSKPYDRRIGLLTKGNVEMETKIRNKAKEDMETEAIEKGILETAKENIEGTLAKLLWEDIKINVKFHE